MKTVYLRIKESGEPKVIQAGEPCREGEKIYEVRGATSALDAKCLYALYQHALGLDDEGLDDLLEKDGDTYVKLKQALRRVTLII